MARVLITGVGGTGPIATAQSLLEHSPHEVVGADMNPRAVGFHVVDECTVIPAASDDDWPAAMRDIVEEFDIDIVVPLVDEELLRLLELKRLLSDTPIVAPRPKVVYITLDKYALAQKLAANNLTTPKTVLASEAERMTPEEYPLIAKPRHGRGSRGVRTLDSPEDLAPYLADTDRARDKVVLQQRITGTEYTTSVVVTKQDRLLGIVPKEVIEKEGNTVRGVTRDAEDVTTSCRKLVEFFLPNGPLNVQQIMSEQTGEVYTIEINPRFSSTACLTVAAGVNELDLLIRDALGESVPSPPEFDSDLHIVRYQDQLFVKQSELVEESEREVIANE